MQVFSYHDLDAYCKILVFFSFPCDKGLALVYKRFLAVYCRLWKKIANNLISWKIMRKKHLSFILSNDSLYIWLVCVEQVLATWALGIFTKMFQDTTSTNWKEIVLDDLLCLRLRILILSILCIAEIWSRWEFFKPSFNFIKQFE